MRYVGIVLLLLGVLGVAYFLAGAFARRRPLDVAFALAAPVALCLVVLGALLLFVPGFLSS